MADFMIEYEDDENDETEINNVSTYEKGKEDGNSEIFAIKKSYSVKFNLENHPTIKLSF